ncbi:SEFIR domain-containing protein [Nocardia bovistercoris]|uniref:TIR domain-containing protein n=1 Tax=Nocardia bovistercoris TaxID=2785916 RepID=A0A931IH93_9NOCA|nr:SEFIR domain-containing protein [Nocardia bovistercoris]MBH0781394.1 TIR domain-containing protein [Nocardia bovistercoris]
MIDESETMARPVLPNPTVFVSYAHDSDAHKEHVEEFCTFLRSEIGLDVELDIWAASGRHKWSDWAVRQIGSVDFVLVIASPEYRRRAAGEVPPGQGRGVRLEAAVILDQLTENQDEATTRFLPVVLPGGSLADIPPFLFPYSVSHYVIEEFTRAGVQELLQTIDGASQKSRPPLGTYHGHDRQPSASAKSGGARASARPADAPQANAGTGPAASLLTDALRPVSRGSDLRETSAELNGVHYGHSIVHRCSSFCGDPRSAVEYNIGRAYRRFETVVGVLDDATDSRQVGFFQIFTDDVAQEQVQVTLGDPVTLRCDVSGVLRLRLVAYRPDTVGSPLLAGIGAAVGRSANLPALAWGNPTLYL